MEFKDTSLKPIFMQVAEWVEDEILKDNLKEGDKILSQTDFAKLFSINPITAGKGVNLLESRGIVAKKRGIGMFVVAEAKMLIFDYRRNSALTSIIDDLIEESKVLNISTEHLISIIKKRMRDNQDD